MLLWTELLRSVPLPTTSLFPKKKDIANGSFKEMLDICCGLEENEFSFSSLSVPGYLMGVEWLMSQSRGVKIQELT